jgi:hypothetical protein
MNVELMSVRSLFDLFLLTIVLSVLHFTASDYPFGIFKLICIHLITVPHFIGYYSIDTHTGITQSIYSYLTTGYYSIDTHTGITLSIYSYQWE